MQFLNQEEKEKKQRRIERVRKKQEELDKRAKNIRAQEEKINNIKKSLVKERTHALCQWGGIVFKVAGWTGDNDTGYISGDDENFLYFLLCNKDVVLNAIYGRYDWKTKYKEEKEKTQNDSQAEGETPQTQPAHSSESAQNYQK